MQGAYWQWDFSEFFADAVFHDAPQVETVVWFFRNACASLTFWQI